MTALFVALLAGALVLVHPVSLADAGELVGILGMLYGVAVVAVLALVCILGTIIDLSVSLWRIVRPVRPFTDRHGIISRTHLPILANGARNRSPVGHYRPKVRP